MSAENQRRQDGGEDAEPVMTRRELIKWGAPAGIFTAITGGLMYGELTGKSPEDPPGPSGPYNETETPTATPTETETETPTETPEPRFPQEGEINAILEGEQPWPQEFFNGDVDLEVRNSDGQKMNQQELLEKYHYNEIYDLAENDGGVDDRQLLKELPKKLDDDDVYDWIRNDLVEPLANKNTDIPDSMKEFFIQDEYLGDGNFDHRMENSKWDKLWYLVANNAIDIGVSSANNFIKTAAIAGTEYYSAGNETFTTHMVTNDGTHGLGFALTGLTWNQDEKNQQGRISHEIQETHGIETDPGREEFIWDLDELETYPNGYQNIMIENESPEGGNLSWKRLAFTDVSPENVTVNFHEGGKFEDFLRNPDQQIGMKYPVSAALAAHINHEAHPDGQLPEFEGATIDVYTDRIEYQLAA